MKLNRTLTGLAASVVLAAAGTAQADVLTFEDLLTGSSNGAAISSGPAAGQYALDDPGAPTPGREFFQPVSYHGFIFEVAGVGPDSGGPAGSWFYTLLSPALTPLQHSGAVFLATEGVCGALDPSGNCTQSEVSNKASLAISSVLGADFVFEGAWFASQSTGVTVAYKLFKDGIEVFDGTVSNTFTLNVNNAFQGSTWVASGYAGLVDQVFVYGRQGQFGLDDFQYSAAPIPEPATYGLMAAGLLGVAGLVRRRKQAE